MNDLDLLRLETATICVLSESGRAMLGRSPERGAPPRMSLGRSRSGSAVWLRHDVEDESAREIQRLVASEPWPGDPKAAPARLDEYVRLLGASVEDADLGGPIYVFPGAVAFEHSARLIWSGTAEGDHLVACLESHGMPDALSSLGFVDVGEFWGPWCMAMDGEEIASIAFTVGSTPVSAEVGVCSMVTSRGRGFASAATAGWASHGQHRGRTLFYSTSWTNVSSQRVTERLGLRCVGTRFTIA